MFTYLRIAVTAMSLTACVLLIALWVRSYGHVDIFVWRLADWKELSCQSRKGELSAHLWDTSKQWTHSRSWYLNSTSMQRLEAIKRQFLDALGQPTTRSRPWFRVGQSYIAIPHWFSVMIFGISAALGAVPWIRKRFSLRTLLMVTTLVAVVLGIVVAAQ